MLLESSRRLYLRVATRRACSAVRPTNQSIAILCNMPYNTLQPRHLGAPRLVLALRDSGQSKHFGPCCLQASARPGSAAVLSPPRLLTRYWLSSLPRKEAAALLSPASRPPWCTQHAGSSSYCHSLPTPMHSAPAGATGTGTSTALRVPTMNARGARTAND